MTNYKALYILILLFFSLTVFAQQAEDYNWQNVPIGGGGYITGMKIHPLDPDKRFYRTDVGGAYRWDAASGRMVQMIHLDNKNLYAVAGIALHPTDVNTLYLGVGRNCDPSQNAILKSTDGGINFSIVSIPGGTPFWFSANGGRACDTNADTNGANNGDKDRQGTPMAINPFNTNELYIGTREKGLYIMDLTTNQVTQIPHSEIPHNSDQYSIRSVVFHPTLPKVYIAYPGHGVFIGNTTNRDFWNLDYAGGASYPQLLDAIDISISKNADYMLVACKTQGIMKATNIASSVSWTQLTGLNTADTEGYLTAECSPHNNNVAITVVADWNHINEFQVTTNAGSTWNTIGGSVPTANNIFPWRDEAFASHVSQIAFDPVDPSKLFYTSWFSTFSTDNFSTTGPVSWHNFYSKGHEEIVTTDLLTFPSNSEGNFLMVGSGDHSGFLFDNGIENPDNFATFHILERADFDGAFKKSSSMDFCESQPDNLILMLTENWDNSPGGIYTSNNGGLDWAYKTTYNTNNERSIVAMSSGDPKNVIALNENSMKYTSDINAINFQNSIGSMVDAPTCNFPFNVTCLANGGVSATNMNSSVFAGGRNIAADKNYDCVFYFYEWDGDFSISTDGGKNWCVINTNSLPATSDAWNKTRLISIPGHSGHLWININNDLWHSTNAGTTWTNYSNQFSVNNAKALSFGKGFNNNYPALYIYGSIDGVGGDFFYRSDDAGISWVKINDHLENEIWGDNKIIAGDRNIPGRLYASASGQGVVYGESVNVIACDNVEKTVEGEFNTLNAPNVPNWVVSQINGATMTGTTNAWTKAVLDITNPGINNYDLQLWQDNHSMEAGQYYLIQLDLRADDTRNATIKLRNRTNGTTYLERDLTIQSTAQEYAFLMYSNVTDNDLRLTFMVGGNDETIYIDHIRFRAYCSGDEGDLDCLNFISLTDQQILPDTYNAANEINSNGAVMINAPVIFEAADTICLDAGFTVKAGAVFSVKMDGCF